jgi:2-polyprenyl-6-methoxyphenol hydroxylase-like FAD-dependent oxidoreductase
VTGPVSDHDTAADVLVVGGGPVGMLLAAELGTQGVDTLVLERNPVTVDQPKAGTLHARTVQSLARRGYLRTSADWDPRARVVDGFHFAGMPGLRIAAPANEGPPIAGQTQADLERVFELRATRLGVRVRRGHEVVRVTQDENATMATVVTAHGETYRATARFLVGADGARSVVRAQSEVDSETHPATIAALLGQVRLLDPFGTPRGWHRTERGWLVVNNNPAGYSRVITFDFGGPHADRHAPLTLAELRAQASRIAGHDVPMTDAVFLSRFSDFSRLVTRYRIGRILLAGDAAHVHFPVGGQGLNLGLQDAFNLGWKLAATVSGTARADLLDTYHAERHPAARRVIDNTRAQAALMNPDPALDPLRDLFTDLMRLDDVAAYLGDMISDQEVRYPARDGNRYAGEFLPNVALGTESGDRSLTELLTPGRPLLIILDLAADELACTAAPWAGRVSVVRGHCAHELPWRAALVRPDGYLAWAQPGPGSDVDGLRAALLTWFGPPGTDPAPARAQSEIDAMPVE